jgi:hypothetical protein
VRSFALALVVIAGCGPSVRDVLHRTAQCDAHGRSGCWVALARETIPPPSVGRRTVSIEDLRREVTASGVHTEAPTCYECACPAEHADGCRAHVVYVVPVVEGEGPTLWDRGWRPSDEVLTSCADANSVVECPFASDAAPPSEPSTSEATMPVRTPLQTPPPPVQTPMPRPVQTPSSP